ncbi:hypothetical protein N206_03905 [Helicobacter pylori UM111]|nr:hypothetical protein N206_03905 [Helicobacter pylori UM111]EQL53639.1 hypothetical protein N404_06030 [Helicobacter pylori FD506]
MPWKTKNEKLRMAKALYLKISFLGFNDCFFENF